MIMLLLRRVSLGWHRTSDQPLSELIIVYFLLSYWRLYVLLGLNELSRNQDLLTCNMTCLCRNYGLFML